MMATTYEAPHRKKVKSDEVLTRHLQIWAGMERDKYVEVYWILIIEM